MVSDTLIFCDGIVEPPTETLAIRSLCLHLHAFSKSPLFLFETKRSTTDMYYRWLKKTGINDFIEEIIYPEYNIKGLRLSETMTHSPCFKIDRVSWDNLNFILNKIS